MLLLFEFYSYISSKFQVSYTYNIPLQVMHTHTLRSLP